MLTPIIINIIITIIVVIVMLSIIDYHLKSRVNNKIIITRPFNLNKVETDNIKQYDVDKLFNQFEAPRRRPERTQMGFAPKQIYSNNPLQPFPTRGYPDDYHLLGVLINNNESNDYNKLEQDNKIINLYGRQKYPGSNEYEYYTSLSTGNTITKMPIDNNRELFNEDKVFIKGLGKEFKVQLYPNEELKYVPFV